MRLPDFIVGGAPRCGTTWLRAALDTHPAIHMAAPARPEPKFFLVDERYAQGLAWYAEQWFSEVPASATAVGEKSTNYLESAVAAERIARDLPGVKLIFVLRNPVERALSNYLWTRDSGLERESFETALALEPERERRLPQPQRYARPFSYFTRGLYADCLEPYLRLFPREQVRILRFEQLVEDANNVLGELHAFLGVQPRPLPPGAALEKNQTSSKGTWVGEEVRASLAARYTRPNRRLAHLLGWSEVPWKS